MKIKFFIIFIVIIILLIGGLGVFLNKKDNKPGVLDGFAQCISDSGAKFYGTFWCTHCSSQKKMFGPSAKYLPYIECSTEDGRGQLQVCKDAKIEGYPAWVFGDGSVLMGEIPLQTLSEKTQCLLP